MFRCAFPVPDGIVACNHHHGYQNPVLLARTDTVVEDRPLVAQGNIVTSGGCLSSGYLAGWFLAKALGLDKAMSILETVAPVGQRSQFGKQAREIIGKQLDIPAKRPLYC